MARPMNPIWLYLCMLLFPLLPTTKLFGLKRSLLRLAGARIGRDVRICSNVRIYGNGILHIGDNTWIGHETLIICSEEVHIGSNVDIAPRCYIGTGTHEVSLQTPNVAGPGISHPIYIGDGSWLCTHSVILPKVRIGNKTIIAAGAVVTQDIPPLEMWGGVPAKKLKSLC